MRIEALNFERYGIFTDRELKFKTGAALHVVFGKNEAGKTSALAAIGDLLFGFGARTQYDFRHDSRMLRIGGRFSHSDGRVFAVRRRKGTKNTLIDEADQPLPDDSLAALLNGITRDSFEREFGLTAEALRLGGQDLLAAGGRLAETLAASSAELTALSRVKDRLKAEADDLFTPRRTQGKPFYLAVDRREAADKRLREAIITPDALRHSEMALQEATKALDELNEDHARSGSQLALWQRTLRVRSKLARLKSLHAELAELSALPAVSDQVAESLRASLDQHSTLSQAIAALDAAENIDRVRIETMAVDDRLLSQGDAIDALRERLGAVRKAREDLPRRRLARDVAEAALNEAARGLGLESHVAVLAKHPNDLALAHARELLAQINRIDNALAEANVRRDRALQERSVLVTDEGAPPALAAPDLLRSRFEAFSDIPLQADRQRREAAMLQVETSSLADMVSALDPTPASLDALRALPLPDPMVVATHARAFEFAVAEVKSLGEALAVIDQGLASLESDLSQLSRGGAVPSRIDLQRAREQRDRAFEQLRTALDEDGPVLEDRFSEAVRSSHAVDELTDRLLGDTERATRCEDMRRRLADGMRERGETEARLAALQGQMAERDVAWKRCWVASGLTPRSPSDMQRWRERVNAILDQHRKLDLQKIELETLTASLAAGKNAVIAFLENIGQVPDRELPADILFREAKVCFDELQKVWADAKARSVAVLRVERDLTEAAASHAAAMQARAEVERAWPAAMSGIGLACDLTPAPTEIAIGIWQGVAVPKASHEREHRSVEAIEADLVAFDRDVFDIIGHIAPGLKSESAQESLARLLTQLTEMRRLAEARLRIQEAMARRSESRTDLTAQRAAITALLNDATNAFGVKDVPALSEPIARLMLRLELERERNALQREVLEIGDERDELALRQEQQGLDLDALPGEIERETLRQKKLLEDIGRASELRYQKQSERDALMQGRNAAAAAAERADASAELLSIADRWVLRAAASQLAGLAIERHRAMVQDPMVARAGLLFATATNGAFAELALDYGLDDQPTLVARRADGDLVPVHGLSEGTRDQLFLALRLALLERRTAEPMPFIGDDLLTSFDDDRTEAVLRLLAAAGLQRQIVLFTHHRHVADLAQSLEGPKVDIIAL